MTRDQIRVLLIEDNPADERLIRELVRDAKRECCDIESVATMAAALAAMRSTRFDVIALDLSLPDSAGLDSVRAMSTASPSTPIVVITGRDDDELALAAVKQGAQDYLIKGRIDGDSFLRSVRYAIERKALHMALDDARENLERLVEVRTEQLTAANAGLRTATETRNRFFAKMNHELRTPLGSILGFSDVLLRGLVGDVTPEQRKQLGMIHSAGQQLLELVDDLLDFSRIEAGRDAPKIGCADLAQIVRDAATLAEPLATRKGLELRVRVPDGQIEAATDERRVRQIAVNLLSNAVKYTDSGHVEISATTEDDGVHVRVTDTGIGIKVEDLERIFVEFEQLDGALTRRGGTGLGLAICRGYADLLGGELRVRSTLGRGSTFELVLPVEPVCALP